ncbi:carboxypeptidase-like regulatory domain-containing protein [Gammaproteobacteria bacterium AS21]|jgi:nickel transport protein
MHFLKTLPLLFVLFSAPSFAHLLKVFAYTEQGPNQSINVNGKVYFAGGSAVPDLTIKVLASDNSTALTSTTNELGKFAFNIADAHYQIIANSHDGHRATWEIKSSAKKSNLQQAKTTVTPANAGSQITTEQLENIINSALAKQIQPLSEQIIDLQEKARFSDILGAIGYIFGIFGLFIWWQHNKKTS